MSDSERTFVNLTYSLAYFMKYQKSKKNNFQSDIATMLYGEHRLYKRFLLRHGRNESKLNTVAPR